MQEPRTLTKEGNVGAKCAKDRPDRRMWRLIRRNKSKVPMVPAPKLRAAIASVLKENGVQERLAACTTEIGRGAASREISALEILQRLAARDEGAATYLSGEDAPRAILDDYPLHMVLHACTMPASRDPANAYHLAPRPGLPGDTLSAIDVIWDEFTIDTLRAKGKIRWWEHQGLGSRIETIR